MIGQYTFEMPPRIVAIGDLEGNIEGLDAILIAAGLMNTRGKWVGDKAHLVQLGDIFGRAVDPKSCANRLRSLSRQAERAGGRVHVILGNHEAEVAHRYEFQCSASEYMSFVDETSLERWNNERTAAIEDFWHLEEEASLPISSLTAAWESLHPPGREEFRKALAHDGEYGRWLLTCPIVIRIGKVLFSHAGVAPKFAELGIDILNALAHRDMKNNAYFPNLPSDTILADPEGPLWTRRFGRDEVSEEEIRTALLLMGASVQVFGHTNTKRNRITDLRGRMAIDIDTGIGHLDDGRLSALVIENNVMKSLYPPHGYTKIGVIPTL